MKSAEQIKGSVKSMANRMNLKPQEVLQIFMFERLVERLSVSPYKDNFILKGGLLIASMIGIGERTTMDMDTTIQGLPMTEQAMEQVVKKLSALMPMMESCLNSGEYSQSGKMMSIIIFVCLSVHCMEK